jgi:hypothetical protein
VLSIDEKDGKSHLEMLVPMLGNMKSINNTKIVPSISLEDFKQKYPKGCCNYSTIISSLTVLLSSINSLLLTNKTVHFLLFNLIENCNQGRSFGGGKYCMPPTNMNDAKERIEEMVVDVKPLKKSIFLCMDDYTFEITNGSKKLANAARHRVRHFGHVNSVYNVNVSGSDVRVKKAKVLELLAATLFDAIGLSKIDFYRNFLNTWSLTGIALRKEYRSSGVQDDVRDKWNDLDEAGLLQFYVANFAKHGFFNPWWSPIKEMVRLKKISINSTVKQRKKVVDQEIEEALKFKREPATWATSLKGSSEGGKKGGKKGGKWSALATLRAEGKIDEFSEPSFVMELVDQEIEEALNVSYRGIMRFYLSLSNILSLFLSLSSTLHPLHSTSSPRTITSSTLKILYFPINECQLHQL